MTDNRERCWVCGLPIDKPKQGSITTGYGLDEDGHKVCYACCADSDRDYMKSHERITLYFVKREVNGCKQWFVSNWPGSLEFKAFNVSKGSHNIARTQYSFSFRDDTGKLWHGRQYGQWNEIAHCRKAKQQ